MKLATLNDGSRDGALVVVSSDGRRFADAQSIARNLQDALDRWDACVASLEALSVALNRGDGAPLVFDQVRAPLPRAYEWVDGSAYINHIVLVRKARGAEPPETLETDPLVYQGGSGVLLDPFSPIVLPDTEWGCDYEAEFAVILADTPVGVRAADAAKYIRLITMVNDVTYRNLVPNELQKGFGFFQSKPASAFGPFAVTPDELGDAWKDGRVHLTLKSSINGAWSGDPDAGPEMHFSFFDLLEHITKTRAYTAGTLLGSGTVSNRDPSRGVSCLAERRMREIIDSGAATTPFLKPGDIVRIEALDQTGATPFGFIEQKVVRPS